MIETERRGTAKASQLSIEEVYTDVDAISTSDGYQFDFPYQFNADESQNKLIGIRRLSVTPNNYIFNIGMKVYPVKIDGTEATTELIGNTTPQCYINVTSTNSTEEILCLLTEKLKGTGTFKDVTDVREYRYGLIYEYNQRTGDMTLKVEQTFIDPAYSNELFYIDFELSFDMVGDDIDSFLSFLNNKNTADNKRTLSVKNDYKHFKGVWNRSSLNFHASFSNSHRRYIGRMGDVWNIPSKLYKYQSGCSWFTISVTTDGKNKIELIDSEFTIELCFILNYKNNITI